MTSVRVTYWRDIPVLVTAREGVDEVSAPLSPRFQDLVDRIAMRAGLADSDAYLAEWRTDAEGDRSGPAGAVAAQVAAEIEGRFEEIRRAALGAGDAP